MLVRLWAHVIWGCTVLAAYITQRNYTPLYEKDTKQNQNEPMETTTCLNFEILCSLWDLNCKLLGGHTSFGPLEDDTPFNGRMFSLKLTIGDSSYEI